MDNVSDHEEQKKKVIVNDVIFILGFPKITSMVGREEVREKHFGALKQKKRARSPR